MNKNNNKNYGLQMFAAPNNLTRNQDVQVRAREIDFVTSFGSDMQALLDILGIAKMTPKANGTALKVKTASGTLESGKVGEGDEIPYSHYAVNEEIFDTIEINKYRKGVSLEAIAEKGYDAAVLMTDNEFKADLRSVVIDKMYDSLKKGSLVGHESTWQMAVSMSIGRVLDKFKKMRKSATGIVVWVNTIDLYKYIGSASVTTQTAFGLQYIKNFLGADVVFISSEIPENTVIATPLNNLVAYYVDPADSEFAKAGLSYTTDSATGFIGFHAQGNYERAITDMYAIMGVRIFAEYLDAIAYTAVGSSDTQTLSGLTATQEVGAADGTVAVTVAPEKMSISNVYKYKVGAAATTVTYGMDVKNWSKWDGKSDIVAAKNSHITIVEADSSYKAVASVDVTVTVGTVAE